VSFRPRYPQKTSVQETAGNTASSGKKTIFWETIGQSQFSVR